MPAIVIARARRATLAVKVETDYGTSEFSGAPGAGDLVPVENLTIEEVSGLYPWGAATGTLDGLPAVPGELTTRLTFDFRLRGRGTAYSSGNKPEASPILQALAFSESVDATLNAEKVVYKHAVIPHKSLSAIFMQENAPSVSMVGMVGDASILNRAGQPVSLRCTFMGKHGGRGTQSLVTFVPPATPLHPIIASADVGFGSENYAARWKELTIALNNVVSPIAAPNDQFAIAGFFITKDPARPIQMGLDPEAVAASTFDWFGKHRAGTTVAWSFQTNGPQYTRVKFGESGNKAQISQVNWGVRDELRTNPVVLSLLAKDGQDSLVITFD